MATSASKAGGFEEWHVDVKQRKDEEEWAISIPKEERRVDVSRLIERIKMEDNLISHVRINHVNCFRKKY